MGSLAMANAILTQKKNKKQGMKMDDNFKSNLCIQKAYPFFSEHKHIYLF